MAGFNVPYPPLADIFRQFLPEPWKLHAAMMQLFKLIEELYASRTQNLKSGQYRVFLPDSKPADVQRIISVWQRRINSGTIPEDVQIALRQLDIAEFCRYVTSKWDMQTGRPEDVVPYPFAGTEKADGAVNGKLFLLKCCLILLQLSNEDREILRQVVAAQPQIPPSPTPSPSSSTISELKRNGIPALNKALSRYQHFPYTMTGAPTHKEIGLRPGEPGYDNVFCRARGGPGLRVPIWYPKGAPLARRPRDDGIVATLLFFLRVVRGVVGVWGSADGDGDGGREFEIGLKWTVEVLNAELADPFTEFKVEGWEEVKGHLAKIDVREMWEVL